MKYDAPITVCPVKVFLPPKFRLFFNSIKKSVPRESVTDRLAPEMTVSGRSRLHHYILYPSPKDKKASVYTEAWSPNKSGATRFQTLISDIDNVVFGVDNDKNIHALHSFKVSGGSLLRP
jgi:hypothetical protein